MGDFGLDFEIYNDKKYKSYDDMIDEPLNINAERSKNDALLKKGKSQQFMDVNEMSAEATKLKTTQFDRFREGRSNVTKRLKACMKDQKDESVYLDVKEMNITTLHDEYKDRFTEKRMFKSRESKISNKKSRLYKKNRNGALIEDYINRQKNKNQSDIKEPEIKISHEELTDELLQEKTKQMSDMVENIMSYKIAKVNLMNDSYVASHVEYYDQMNRDLASYERMRKAYPGFEDNLEETHRRKLRVRIERLDELGAFFRVRKMIILDPYYRRHYNEELSMNVSENDSEDKKRLAKLLRLSFYLGKNTLGMAVSIEPRTGTFMPVTREEMRGANAEAGLTLKAEGKYMKEWEGKICQASKYSVDWDNVYNEKIGELEDELNKLLELNEKDKETKETFGTKQAEETGKRNRRITQLQKDIKHLKKEEYGNDDYRQKRNDLLDEFERES